MVAKALLGLVGCASALQVASLAPGRGMCARRAAVQMGTQSDEMGIPCIGECSLPSYPNLPDSVHPGVVTGQALIDLLNDAKEKVRGGGTWGVGLRGAAGWGGARRTQRDSSFGSSLPARLAPHGHH